MLRVETFFHRPFRSFTPFFYTFPRDLATQPHSGQRKHIPDLTGLSRILSAALSSAATTFTFARHVVLSPTLCLSSDMTRPHMRHIFRIRVWQF